MQSNWACANQVRVVFSAFPHLQKKRASPSVACNTNSEGWSRSVLSRLQKSVWAVASGEENTSPPSTKTILNSSLPAQKTHLIPAMKVAVQKIHHLTPIIAVQFLHR